MCDWLHVWLATCVIGYMCGWLHVWLWSPPHIACMDEEFGNVDGTEWTRQPVTSKCISHMSVR